MTVSETILRLAQARLLVVECLPNVDSSMLDEIDNSIIDLLTETLDDEEDDEEDSYDEDHMFFGV